MLNITPITGGVIDSLEAAGCLKFLDELSIEERELFLLKSLLVSCVGDTHVNATALLSKTIVLLNQFQDESQDAIQVELLIPFTLITGSMAYLTPHQSSWAESNANLVKSPYFTFISSRIHENHSIQTDVILKNEALALLTDPSAYFAIFSRHPNYMQTILHNQNKFITILTNNYRIFSSMNTDLRVVHFLHMLSVEEGMFQKKVTLDISQNEIATALSISRGSVAKCLAKLYDEGIAESGYKSITVSSEKLLEYTNKYS